MDKTKEIHELIHNNLCLLKAAGHYIDFKKGMFKEPNLPGFEAVGYALLMIIDPTECKNKIPWPLVNDKAQAREFRTNFTKFVKTINMKYSNANIPEINASSLQFPGGIRFLDFMYRLSNFAVELELKKTLSPEERENLLVKPVPCKTRTEQKVQLAIVEGALSKELASLAQLRGFQANGPSVLRNMNSCLINITAVFESVSERLKFMVSTLDFDEKMKGRLLDIEDSTAIEEYNVMVEKKYEDIVNNSFKLSQLYGLAEKCCQPQNFLAEKPDDTQCLDGHKLGMNRFMNELAGRPVVNVAGCVKLTEVLEASRTAVTRLVSSPGSSTLQLPAQDLKVRSEALAARAMRLEAVLQNVLQLNKHEINSLRSIVYSTMDKKNVQVAWMYLKERAPLNFVTPRLIKDQHSVVKGERKRKSIGKIINRKKRIVCTLKTRREPKKHVSSTPFFKTPAYRKSLFNTLPSGTRQKQGTKGKPLHVTPDDPTPLALSFAHESIASEPSPISSFTADDAIPPPPVLSCAANDASPPPPAVRCGRKSINDIVQRFLKLKQSMSISSNSKNESETCNEIET